MSRRLSLRMARRRADHKRQGERFGRWPYPPRFYEITVSRDQVAYHIPVGATAWINDRDGTVTARIDRLTQR